jgi:xanthine dehydrogenase YagR molybdenum-binding subunit
VSNAIAKTSDEVRKVLLRLAKKVPGSPVAASELEDVILVDGKIVDKKETSHAVSIADAMRHGALDRIELESATNFKDDSSFARNTHSAIFAEVTTGPDSLTLIQTG